MSSREEGTPFFVGQRVISTPARDDLGVLGTVVTCSARRCEVKLDSDGVVWRGSVRLWRQNDAAADSDARLSLKGV